MKIIDLKCAVIGQSPIVRIVTDEGISGYGEIESSKPYVKPQVLFYKDLIVGEDPTNVERVMLKIRLNLRCGISQAKPRVCLSTSCWAARFATMCVSTTAACASR